MPNLKDLTGQKFERLTVIERTANNNRNVMWLCECECGEIKAIPAYSLLCGDSKSCGCLKIEKTIERSTTHNLSHTGLYKVWRGIKSRCYTPSASHFERYGGRGITVCEEWLNDFNSFYNWSMENGYSEGLSIDRKDNNLGYSPQNCQWATQFVQTRNREIGSNNTSGAIGVNWHNATQKWAASIGADKKSIHLGVFENIDDAIAARKAAEKKYWNK